RYSRVRTSAFLGRRGVSTFRIWVSGDTIFKAGFVIGFNAPFRLLSVKNAKYGKLQWSFIGQKLDRPRLGRSIVAQLGHDDLAWPSNSSWLRVCHSGHPGQRRKATSNGDNGAAPYTVLDLGATSKGYPAPSPIRACTHKIAVGQQGLVNVRFALKLQCRRP